MIISTVAATCIALNIMMEARSESREGQWAVAQVTLNRLSELGDTSPERVCGTVASRDQFSWTSQRAGQSIGRFNGSSWRQAMSIARQALLWYRIRHRRDYSGGATHYHTIDIKPPYWTRNMYVTARIGRHIFYAERESLIQKQVVKTEQYYLNVDKEYCK